MRNRGKIIGALGLLGLFTAYLAVTMTFTHVHFINGVLITHSHPFSHTHEHTAEMLIVIGNISLGSDALEVEMHEDCHPLRPLLCVLKAEAATPTLKGEPVRLFSLRAPPQAL